MKRLLIHKQLQELFVYPFDIPHHITPALFWQQVRYAESIDKKLNIFLQV